MYAIKGELLSLNEKCEKGSQLRPHIVWFGEAVPLMEEACLIAADADIFVVIGSSLVVYPAASLIEYAPIDAPKFIVDSLIPPLQHIQHITAIEATAVNGVKELKKQLDKLLR